MCYWPLGVPVSSHSCQMHLAKHPSWHPLALFLTLLCSLLCLWLPAEQHSLKLKYLTCTNLQPDSSSLRHGPNTQVLRRWTCKFTPEVRLPYKSNPQTTLAGNQPSAPWPPSCLVPYSQDTLPASIVPPDPLDTQAWSSRNRRQRLDHCQHCWKVS